MSSTLRFTVLGLPRPGGSKRGFPIRRKGGKIGVAMVDASGENGHNWRADIRAAAIAAVDASGWKPPPRNVPIEIRVLFAMPRPRAHFNHVGGIKAKAPTFHTIRPDATKLLRSAEDALTGIVWHDDAQITRQSVMKMYGEPSMTIEVLTIGANP